MQRDDYRPDLPVSRGQWQAIARALCTLSGETPPENRFEATELLARATRTARERREAAAGDGDAGGRS